MNPWFGKHGSKWPVVPLREVATLGTGHTPSRKVEAYWKDCTIPWLTVEDVRANGVDSLQPVMHTHQKISQLGMENSAAVLHPTGTVMLSRTASIGFVCVVGRPMATTQAFVTWTPNSVRLDSKFLLACLATMRQHFFAIAYGATHLTIYFPDIKKLRIPLPPLPTQSKIATFLDYETAKIDALIEKQQQLIALLKEKRQAVISHAVTKGLNPDAPMRDSGVEWLGEVPEHWRIRLLKRSIAPGSSVSYGIVQPGEPADEGVPFIQTTNMSRGTFNAEELQRTTANIAARYPRSRLHGGEVLLGIRASIGAAYVAPLHLRGCNLSRGVARISPTEDLTASYLVWYLRSAAVSHYWGLSSQGSTFSEVSIETVKELHVLLPSVADQRAISHRLTELTARIDDLEEAARQQNALLQERRTALISAAVTGKIDVRNWAPPEPTTTPEGVA